MSAPSEDIDKHVTRRYDVQQKLGKGAYGIVWKATDRKSRETVALKKIFDAFQNSTDAQRTYREVIYLQQMSKHENIIKLQRVEKADNDRDLYLIFEYMETDLHAVIRANILEEIHKQYIMYQCFKALMYMHSAGLVHRDIKPSNLLLNSECLMKVADFGLARKLKQPVRPPNDPNAAAAPLDGTGPDEGASDAFVMTDYVATRWYRAPEVLFGSCTYSAAVDLWSLGCIFGEMILGKPLFAGSTTLNQLEKIAEVLGLPSDAEVTAMDSTFARGMIDGFSDEVSQKAKTALGFSAYLKLPDAEEAALELMEQLMKYDPTERLTAHSGLSHKYCVQFQDKDTEHTYVGMVRPPEGHVTDTLKKTTDLYRNSLYDMIKDQQEGSHSPENGRR